MDLHLEGKVVLVTGGARGIGEAITRCLAAEGAVPVILGRDEVDNLCLVEEIQSEGAVAHQVTVELADPKGCEAAVAEAIRLAGRIDGVVNNAGINDGVGLEHGSYEGFLQSLHNNLIHYYLVTHCALPELVRNRGAIVNISSKVAETGQGSTPAYAAANGGRNALTREWAVELLKYGVRVNSVVVAECFTPQYERWVQTLPDPETALKEIESRIPFDNRMTLPSEIADTVCFLLSERSSHTTGQLVHVDGGYVHLDRFVGRG